LFETRNVTTRKVRLPYDIIEVPEDSADLFEQLGTKSKFWYDDKTMLFKEGRLNTGENWAEVVASRICDLLGLPHAHYDFAVFQGREGVVCPTIVPTGERLVHANEPLAQFHKVSKLEGAYEPEKKHRQTAYTLHIVIVFLRTISRGGVVLPLDWQNAPNGVDGPLGLFVGYLLLDALIANQDRHHENWGVIVRDKETIYMAPTFDHASSLGRELTDAVREERLTTNDQYRSVEYYAFKGQAALYDSEPTPKRLPTVDAFKHAASLAQDAAIGWLDRLEAITDESLTDIFDNIPDDRISKPAISFAKRLVMINKDRLNRIREQLL
jgi:hypothetical protein